VTPQQLARALAWMPRRVPGPKFVLQIGKWLFSVESRDAFAVSAGRDIIGICPFYYLNAGPYMLVLVDPTPLEEYD
jgi:hypothetical protein